MSFSTVIDNFFDGFGPGALFVRARRSGAPTQVFATDDVPFGGPPEVTTMIQEFGELNAQRAAAASSALKEDQDLIHHYARAAD
jgi:hypothetical protein